MAKGAEEVVRLVDATWLRVRPYAGDLTVYGFWSSSDIPWEKIPDLGDWMVCREIEGEREKECFALQANGELFKWKANL